MKLSRTLSKEKIMMKSDPKGIKIISKINDVRENQD